MMTLIWVLAAYIAGLFTPGPWNETIKGWIRALWGKIFNKDQ